MLPLGRRPRPAASRPEMTEVIRIRTVDDRELIDDFLTLSATRTADSGSPLKRDHLPQQA